MSNYPKLANYVSEIDEFLSAFDATHPTLSLSQMKEKEKYRNVYFLRDNMERPEKSESLWEKF